jgi:Protein of unknown function (DUF1566)
MKTYPCWAITILFVIALGASSVSNAALVSRLSGQAYYDTNLNITWLTNANLAGATDWNAAQSWIAGLNSANYLGYNDWRLPTVGPVNGTSFNYGPGGTFYDGTRDVGYNVSAPVPHMRAAPAAKWQTCFTTPWAIRVATTSPEVLPSLATV